MAAPQVVLGASVAALAALGLQLTPNGVAPLVVLEPGARGAMEGLVGVRWGSLLLGDCECGRFGPRTSFLGPARGPCC